MANDVYYDLHMEGDDEYEKSKGQKIAALFFKSVFWIILAFIMGILFYRMYSMREPSMSSDFIADENTVRAMEDHKNDRINGEYSEGYAIGFRTFGHVTLDRRSDGSKLKIGISDYGYDGFQVFCQSLHGYYAKDENGNIQRDDKGEPVVIQRSEYYDGTGTGETFKDDEFRTDEGVFKISNAYFMPQANQLEVTFRFNSDAIKNLSARYADAGEYEEKFLFVIKDSKGNSYSDCSYITGKHTQYTYRRLLFSGIDYSDVSSLTLEIYYAGSETFDTPYASMTVYDSNITLEEKDVSVPFGETKGLIRTK